jgi:Archaea-specific editing domain of threonyl-tRNA synthetase
MKLLCFQAKRFAWKSFSKTLEGAADRDVADELRDCVVVFFHAEDRDEAEDRRKKVFTQTLKHIKWIANKREFRNVVLHSFTHLGGANASPQYAESFLGQMAERLTATDYTVKSTPFGYFCEWDLDVHGESLAKVWKEI